MDGKVSMIFNRNCFPKMTDFSRLGALQAATYILKVVVSKKWCEIDTLLLHATNRKYGLSIRAISSDLEGHLPNAGLIKCNLTNISVTLAQLIDSIASCLSARVYYTLAHCNLPTS